MLPFYPFPGSQGKSSLLLSLVAMHSSITLAPSSSAVVHILVVHVGFWDFYGLRPFRTVGLYAEIV